MVQSTTTPGECDMWKNSYVPMSDYIPTLIEPSGTDPYYTRWHEFKIKDDMYNSLLIKPSVTEPYYTMSLWHVEECRHTHVIYTIPQLTLVVQIPTTPCQFDIWNHANILRSDVCPYSLQLVLQNPATPCQFEMWKNAGIPSSNIHPH